MVILSSTVVYHRHTEVYREPRAHQRDEVGEGHLDVDLGDVPALLHGPDVLVVALHQVPKELVLQVHCRCCRRAKFESYGESGVDGFNEG